MPRNLSSPLSLRELLAETVPVSGEGGGDLSRFVDDSILEKLGHAIAGSEFKKFDRSTGFLFRNRGKIIFEERERIRKPTNFIISFLVCLFVGKPVLDNVFLHSNPRLRRESNKFFPN